MTVHFPQVSIITVVRNGAETIGQTIDSVSIQQQIDFEHLVIDGASTDSTLDILVARRHDRLRWISEPDLGIYDAMNKGIAMARGEWILFLGADDALVDPKVLSDIFCKFETSSYDVICGRSSYLDGQQCVPRLDWHTRVFNTVHHQAALYNRRLFADFRYRLDISVVADYELNYLVYRQQRPFLLIDRHIAISRRYGVSHFASPLQTLIDGYKIRSRYEDFFSNGMHLAAGFLNLIATSLAPAPRCDRAQ